MKCSHELMLGRVQEGGARRTQESQGGSAGKALFPEASRLQCLLSGLCTLATPYALLMWAAPKGNTLDSE